MRENIEISGQTRLYGLFAHPAHHSLSPLMHNTSFNNREIDARYLAFDLQPADLAQGVAAIRALGLGGVNLSMPFKQTIIPMLDEITPRAQLLESVNVIKNSNGHLIGDSVDGEGFFANLIAEGVTVAQQAMVVLGAGGAGLSIIQAGIDHQLAEITVFKRRNPRFERVAQQLATMAKGRSTKVRLVDYDDVAQMTTVVARSTLIVNATNLGMGDYQAQRPAPPGVLAQLNAHHVVCDVIYSPLETQFLSVAKQQGCQTFNGLGMLIYQGALSFKFWTGQDMPVQLVRKTIQTQLNQQ